jgi:hypothetical protein
MAVIAMRVSSVPSVDRSSEPAVIAPPAANRYISERDITPRSAQPSADGNGASLKPRRSLIGARMPGVTIGAHGRARYEHPSRWRL